MDKATQSKTKLENNVYIDHEVSKPKITGCKHRIEDYDWHGQWYDDRGIVEINWHCTKCYQNVSWSYGSWSIDGKHKPNSKTINLEEVYKL